MDIKKYKEFLLSAIPTAKPASGGTFINCRCFNCPDSSNPKSKHFYIAIPQAEDEPSWYYCHKCHCSGLVTHKTLIEWGIYDENIAINLTDHNKKCSTKSKNSKYYDRSLYNFGIYIRRNSNGKNQTFNGWKHRRRSRKLCVY